MSKQTLLVIGAAGDVGQGVVAAALGSSRQVIAGGRSLPKLERIATRHQGEALALVAGDIATEDEDGFLAITDRLSRFSKIGGEMVPHVKVEDELHELAGTTEQKFVVTGVPDGKKGERLVVLHTLDSEEIEATMEKLSQSGLPNLWMPRPNQFFYVEELPHLGTGKLDLRRVRSIAMELSGAGAETL